ncbi:MAG: hypothetical protein DRO67_04890 [Candidatus Asgardarchaeum californiense]|nr:MAG: hypothetical protein DRO67_04890 [Candidatus Asgardarchaeum californiense]
MELKYIKENSCSECGAMIVRESRNPHSHCNGTTRETRTFACGRVVSYSPNFERVEVDTVCPNSDKMKRREKLRCSLIEKLTDIVEKSKVDADFKRKIISHWDYI